MTTTSKPLQIDSFIRPCRNHASLGYDGDPLTISESEWIFNPHWVTAYHAPPIALLLTALLLEFDVPVRLDMLAG